MQLIKSIKNRKGSILFFYFFLLSDGQRTTKYAKKGQNANADDGTTSNGCWSLILYKGFVRDDPKYDS
jgi:hypothetical protein